MRIPRWLMLSGLNPLFCLRFCIRIMWMKNMKMKKYCCGNQYEIVANYSRGESAAWGRRMLWANRLFSKV